MASMLRRKKKGKDEDVQGEGKKKKLTAAEKKKAEAELRATLPMRSAVGRRGVFEITGELSYTFAVGQIPGGQFYPVDIVIKGHLLYLFELGAMPSSKPRGFFMVKRATVTEIGILQNPPLPPQTNVFKIEFAKKQMGHRAYFFKATSNKELKRWVTDLSWRVEEGERKIAAKFDPGSRGGMQPKGGAPELPWERRKKIDETEAGIEVGGERVMGMQVKYEVRQEEESEDEEEALEQAAKLAQQKKKDKAKKDTPQSRGTFKMGTKAS